MRSENISTDGRFRHRSCTAMKCTTVLLLRALTPALLLPLINARRVLFVCSRKGLNIYAAVIIGWERANDLKSDMVRHTVDMNQSFGCEVWQFPPLVRVWQVFFEVELLDVLDVES